MQRVLTALGLAIGLIGSGAHAEHVVRATIQTTPLSTSTEFGLIYANTGLVPAKLLLFCQESISEDDWDGVFPADVHSCGAVDLRIRLSSGGLTAYYLNYAETNPLTFQLHVDPEATPLRAVLGTFSGAKLGAGVVAEGRTMVLHNDQSGVWTTLGQAFSSGGFGIGLDLSMSWLEVYLVSPTDLRQRLGNLKDNMKHTAQAN